MTPAPAPLSTTRLNAARSELRALGTRALPHQLMQAHEVLACAYRDVAAWPSAEAHFEKALAMSLCQSGIDAQVELRLGRRGYT